MKTLLCHPFRFPVMLAAAAAAVTIMTQTPASANQVGDRVTYAFTGKLIAASACTVNNNKIIDVPFGNVGINKLTNGTDYTQNISWTLECGSLTDSNTLQMIIKATPESWDQKAMSSSVTGLGIRILKDGTPWS